MKRLVVVAVLCGAGPAFGDVIPRWEGYSATAKVGAHASLTPDGAWLGDTLSRAEPLEIVEGDGARPKFVERTGSINLLMYADRDSLALHTLDGAVLAPTAAALATRTDDKQPGWVLGAGRELVEVGADDHGVVPVKWVETWGANSKIEVRGFVATNKVSAIYRHVFRPRPSFTPTITLPGSYELLDGPNGKPFVTSTQGNRVRAMTVSKQGKFTLVRVEEGIVGWIATARIKAYKRAAGDDQRAMDRIIDGEADGSTGCTLPAGSIVYDAIDGNVIGEVAYSFDDKPAKEHKGWLRFDVNTRFGVIPVWAKQPLKDSCESPRTKRLSDVLGPPLSPPDPPSVAPTVLEGQRISGEKYIVPNDETKAQIIDSGKSKVVASFKLCVDVQGKVASIKMLKSSGYPGYDLKIEGKMRRWLYRPYHLDGKVVPVCTAVTIVYSQKAAN